MANIRSQIKRNAQNERRRARNRAVRSEVNTRQRAAIAAAESGDGADAALREAIRRIDKAAAAGVLHKNTAARRKSRLVKRVTALEVVSD